MFSVNAKYWISLSQALGYNNPKIKEIAKLYPDVSDFFRGGEREWRLCGFLNARDIEKLNSRSKDIADRILERCSELGYSVISIDDESYPECLFNIYAPPAVLYVDGNLPDADNRFTIGIVGTRRASRYGTENSYKIAYSLSKYGTTIISGGALGVDCASHRGTLAANGVTVCVRGCGINSNYLPANAEMRKAIAVRGAVISEYPPDEEPRSYYFPARNRIIAALSDGLLLIEAGSKSGSLITANLALDMGKEIFALLGNNSPQNEGSNKRIKEGTAVPVTDFMDILAEFDNLRLDCREINSDDISLADIAAIPVKGMKRTSIDSVADERKHDEEPKRASAIKRKNSTSVVSKTKLNITLRGESKKVYDYLGDEPVHIDKLAGDLHMPVQQALSTLTFLEMNGLVRVLQGRYFVLD